MAEIIFAHAGNAARWELTLTEPDGSPKDLTGATGLSFLVKRRIDDADGSAVATSTPTVTGDPSAGVITVALAPGDTSALAPMLYVWGVELTDGVGDKWEFPDPSQEPGKLLVRQGVVTA